MKIAIIGAGILGRLFALASLNKGWHVTLFDKESRDNANGCSYVAAGMLAPCCEMVEHDDIAVYQWGMQSIKRWAEIIKQLDLPVAFQQAGSLCVAHNKDLAELRRFHNNLMRYLPDPQQLILLNAEQIQQLEADLPTNITQGLFLPAEAHIAPPDIMQALGQHLLQQQITWYDNTEVQVIKPFKITFNSTEEKRFDWVFDTRGLGAKPDLPELRGVRGEVLWLYAPEVHLTRPIRLLHPRYPLYIVPRPNNLYVIGATQIESEDFSPISVQSMLELLSAVYSLHKGFIEARIVKTLTQCRPAFANNAPQINLQPGLVQVNGLFRHGYLVAPAIVDEVMRQL